MIVSQTGKETQQSPWLEPASVLHATLYTLKLKTLKRNMKGDKLKRNTLDLIQKGEESHVWPNEKRCNSQINHSTENYLLNTKIGFWEKGFDLRM